MSADDWRARRSPSNSVPATTDRAGGVMSLCRSADGNFTTSDGTSPTLEDVMSPGLFARGRVRLRFVRHDFGYRALMLWTILVVLAIIALVLFILGSRRRV
jgi:hypothetical protein